MTDRPDLRAQRAYRARRSEKIARFEAGLVAVRDRLAGNDKPLAVEIRSIVETALGEAK